MIYSDDVMIELRRDFHKIPEPGFEEFKTSARIKKQVDDMPQDYLTIEPWETGYFIKVQGSNPSQTIGYRTDIDGLPVDEKTGLPFASEHEGFMHACGHDFHMTIALSLLNHFAHEQPKDNLLFIFQPAEEGPGGAEPMMHSAIFKQWKPDWMMALHVDPLRQVGTISTKPGLLFANTGEFNLHLQGKGGHAAFPHDANDMVVASSYMVTQLQSIISRRINPLDSAVITIGKIESGKKENIIADRADTEGTIRTRSKEAMQLVKQNILDMGEGISKSFQCNVDVEWGSSYKQVWNDEARVSSFINFIEANPNVQFELSKEAMTGEDFGFFLDEIPGFMFWLGVDGEAGLHEPTLNPKEAAIPIAVETVKNYLTSEMKR
ncbi:N-acetyldiaminopimelate deacetylase [Geomicrobium sp. JCM 19038]|uniref:N-acetyldiaminopimelate deacetylase n=1 Tax=Geomicrobium sp. JCM 19038 TaxID=1460635 RepID=UPI00045F36DE|nr:N-acetyldiaminopimelate deacetylase [Geomicrobium sp. JCM 19038]GAK07349.1 N-acetyl-L,L-diaminopimelate deacetylase [Geomicrobium sp. JCM 19038]